MKKTEEQALAAQREAFTNYPVPKILAKFIFPAALMPVDRSHSQFGGRQSSPIISTVSSLLRAVVSI